MLGSVLRIDVDTKDPGKEYAVPSTNPFVGISNVRPEIWAYGLRNPWRCSIDRGDRREKEQGGCSVEMSGRVDMRRLISSKEVETTDGELLREIAALMKTSVLDKLVCYLTEVVAKSPRYLLIMGQLYACTVKH